MAVASKQLIKSVFGLADAEFRKAGWTRRKPGIFSLGLSEDIYGRVGLNRAIGRGQGILEVNPIVGVGSHKQEKLLMDLLELKFQPYVGAAIGSNVGYLTPERKYRRWLFHEEDDCEALMADMVAAVEEFGRPFIEKHKDLMALCDAMRVSRLGGPYDHYRVPIALVLSGKNAEADAYLEAKLAERRGRNDGEAQWFRKFAARLREAFRLST